MKKFLNRKGLRSFFRRFRFEKRERLAVVTLVLSFFLIFTQVIWFDWRFYLVLFFGFLTYWTCVWGIKEDIRGIEWFTLFILPVFYSIAVSLFYFLLPPRWLTRLPIVVFYSIGIYAILLSENIFNVAANRSIQLLRAAQSVGFLLTLVVLFLFVNIIFSFHFPAWQNFLIVSIITFFLFLQLFWSTTLENKISLKIFLYSLVCGLGVGEIALSFSFWPIKTTIGSLFITSVFYSIAGIVQEQLLERLFKGVIQSYLWVSAVVFILILIATRWS